MHQFGKAFSLDVIGPVHAVPRKPKRVRAGRGQRTQTTHQCAFVRIAENEGMQPPRRPVGCYRGVALDMLPATGRA